MSQKFKTSSIGFDLSFTGPSTIEDYNAKGGVRASGLPAVLEDAVGAEIAWGTLPEWQDEFDKALTAAYPGEYVRQVNEKATAEAKARAKSDDAKAKAVVHETVTKSVKRFLAGIADDDEGKAKLAAIKALAQSVADGIEIDPSPSKRQGAPKKDYLAKAETWLALSDEELEAKIEAGVAAGANIDLIARDDNGRPTKDSLARFIGAYIDAMAAGL